MLKRNFEKYKNEWEHTRMIASSMIGKVSLPWDKEEKVEESAEYIAERQQYLIEVANKNIDKMYEQV